MSEVAKKGILENQSLPVRKLLLQLSIPTTITMLFNAAYAIADAYFISKTGALQSAAVGVSFSFISIIQAVGFTLGSGGGTLFSKAFGEQKTDMAKSISSLSFWLSLSFGVAMMGFGLLFLNPILTLFGTTDSYFKFAKSYSVYLLLSAPFSCCNFVTSFLLRGAGKVKESMLGLSSAYLLNILLDPFFIFSFNSVLRGLPWQLLRHRH